MDVGVAADNHLRRAIAEHVERRPPRPSGDVAVGVRLNSALPKIEIDDLAAVEFSQR